MLAILPLACIAFDLTYGSRQFHWDTLERAYLLEHPGRYLRSWDGTPRSQFLSFAHVLELPMARAVLPFVPGHSGLRALTVFEAGMAGVTALLLGMLVLFWGGTTFHAMLAQASLGASLAFWKMGSSGEEKIVALATALLFLWLFWRALATGRGARWAAAALGLAILTHLENVVLVPFAGFALLFAPLEWRAARRPLARALTGGVVAALLLYYGVAAWTTHVRTPMQFVQYLTFFHRAQGNNFFEASGATPPEHGPRLLRAAKGLGSFFAGSTLARSLALLAISSAIVLGAVRKRIPTLRRHALILVAIWSLHFVYYEPENHESWTLVAVLLLLVAAVSLPRGRLAWCGLMLPVLLLPANAPYFATDHRLMELQAAWRTIAASTAPNDIVVLVGGIQNGKPVRGSISMRYFLAHERARQVVSLYDMMGVTEREYWDRPYRSPADLQAAIATGRRAFFPRFVLPEVERANQSGRVHIVYQARGDSLYEITRAE